MRNIDEDAVLFGFARSYHEGEITEDRLRQILDHRGYEADEIDGALSDYYWIHVKTPHLVSRFLVPACALCLALLALFFFCL